MTALSRLTNRWSQAKGNAKYAYDKRGSLTNVDYASSTDLKFQFDALGRTTNMVDAAGTTKYGYTNGLLAFEDGPWASDTITNSYNGARQPAHGDAKVVQPPELDVRAHRFGPQGGQQVFRLRLQQPARI
jgi:YD repeat-containing protein